MIYIKPWFFDKFKCIADKCTDNCCIGWEIDVDDEAFRKYSEMPGSFGDELRNKITISPDGSRCFSLAENDRCPFLNDKNLCRIIINCGENALCEICENHPRFYQWFPGVTECGLGLSCEEVCRILLSDDKPLELVEENDGEKLELYDKKDIYESDFYVFVAGLREDFYKILANEELKLEEKLVKILTKTEGFCGEKIKIRNYNNLVSEYKKTEPIDEQWTEFIDSVEEKLDVILSVEAEFSDETDFDMMYSKILAYIMYRHLSAGVFDKSILQRVAFCVESLRFIRLCDINSFCEKGNVSRDDCLVNLKNWSKQIEYSEENTDLLIYGDDF